MRLTDSDNLRKHDKAINNDTNLALMLLIFSYISICVVFWILHIYYNKKYHNRISNKRVKIVSDISDNNNIFKNNQKHISENNQKHISNNYNTIKNRNCNSRENSPELIEKDYDFILRNL